MNQAFWTGDILGMRVIAQRSIIPASIGLWIGLTIFAIIALGSGTVAALINALLAVLAHWINTTVHHQGHFSAANVVGHPLRHVVYWGLIGTDIYPSREGELPPRLHIQRALGGPIASLLTAIPLAVVALAWFVIVGNVWWVLLFALVDIIAVYVVGAFIPLHFIGLETDGSTLLKWWKHV